MCSTGESRLAEVGSLEATEAELTRDVPLLLEMMNHSSAEVNTLERQAGEAEEQYKRRMAQWRNFCEEFHCEHGAAIQRVKPYVSASHVLSHAESQVQRAAQEFSIATS